VCVCVCVCMCVCVCIYIYIYIYIYAHTHRGGADRVGKGSAGALKGRVEPELQHAIPGHPSIFLFFLFTRISARHPGTSISFQKSSLS